MFAVNFTKVMWIEILKVAATKSARLFKWITCGSINITDFKQKYMDEEEEEELHELQEHAPHESDLKGFSMQDFDELKAKFDKSRRDKRIAKELEMRYASDSSDDGKSKDKRRKSDKNKSRKTPRGNELLTP